MSRNHMRPVELGGHTIPDDIRIYLFEQDDGTYVGEALFSGGKRQRTPGCQTTAEAISKAVQFYRGYYCEDQIFEHLKLLNNEATTTLVLIYQVIAQPLPSGEKGQVTVPGQQSSFGDSEIYGSMGGPLHDRHVLDFLENLGFLKSEYKKYCSWDRIHLTHAGAQIAQDYYSLLLEAQVALPPLIEGV